MSGAADDEGWPPVVSSRRTVPMASRMLWEHRLPGVKSGFVPAHDARTNPVLAGNCLYCVSSNPGIAWALEAVSGNIIWYRGLGRLGGSSVSVTRSALFATTAQRLFCLARRDGEIRWSFCPHGEVEAIYTSPVVHGGTIVISDRSGFAHALGARDGQPVWVADVGMGAQVNATPADDGTLLFFGTNGAEAVAVAADSGRVKWRTAIDGSCIWTPLLAGRMVVVRSERTVFWIDRRTGTVRRTWTPGGDIRATALVRDRLFIVVANGDECALHVVHRGRTIYQHAYPQFGSPEGLRWTQATNLVYDARIIGLGILDPMSGERLCEVTGLEVPIAMPEVTKTSIFVLDNDGVVRALRHPVISRRGKERIMPRTPAP